MMETRSKTVSVLLADWTSGDQTAKEKLIPLVYDELRRMARRHMAQERPGHSLQATALVNEAYLQLVDQHDVRCRNRAQFFALAAQVMRHILVDYARRRGRLKRGGGGHPVSLDEAMIVSSRQAAEVAELDDALNDLAKVDPRRSQVVELRYFGGLSVEEVAEVLDVSPVTVMRDWNMAKAWLYRALDKGKRLRS
jgi:RNA polymerase sigma-70 factor (ECF subfamily)